MGTARQHHRVRRVLRRTRRSFGLPPGLPPIDGSPALPGSDAGSTSCKPTDLLRQWRDGAIGPLVALESPRRHRPSRSRSCAAVRLRGAQEGNRTGNRTPDLRITSRLRTVRLVLDRAVTQVLFRRVVRLVLPRTAPYRPVSWMRSWMADAVERCRRKVDQPQSVPRSTSSARSSTAPSGRSCPMTE
jgi:hypothetical protein